jgi:hypothetical protein
MGVPITYRKNPDSLASYDFFDLLSQTAYKKFYPAKCNSGANIVVPDTEFISEDNFILSGAGAVNSTSTHQTTYRETFDLPFNLPKLVGGDILINLPIVQKVAGTALTSRTTASIFKVSDGVETDLKISGASKTYFTPLNLTTGNVSALKITIPTTHFKASDIFRVKETIQSFAWTTPVTDGEVSLGYDPSGSLLSGATMRQTWFIPFLINR